MATIKLQNDKVILKNGKVSCTCCEAGECCMYPAQALFDGLYTVDDLPDSVLLFYDFADELECTRAGSVFTGVLNEFYTYTIYLGEVGGNPQWLLGINGQPDDNFDCLITRNYPRVEEEGGVEDQFADTYTVSYEGDSATVTRQSLCIWTGESISEGETILWRLEYISINDPEAPANFKWLVSIQGLATIAGIKIPPQNSPVGTYGLAGITVS
jgi:hypothetical protein